MKKILLVFFALVACIFSLMGQLDISNYYSPKNNERDIRSKTLGIVLHTTEAGDRSSKDCVHTAGSAHYLVTYGGKVYRIIEKHRVAMHAGRSMWKDNEMLSLTHIGIEVVGHHEKEPTKEQIKALKILIQELQNIYGLSDDDVVTHSMVAYGNPNRWHNYTHRGRKRCAMLYAREDIRKAIGLDNTFSTDPDVVEGRLQNADPYLAQVIYGKSHEAARDTCPCLLTKTTTPWTIAREYYNDQNTLYIFPDKTIKKGDQIQDWDRLPSGTHIVLKDTYRSEDYFEGFREYPTYASSAWGIAGREYDKKSTIYFFPDGRIESGDRISKTTLENLPQGTRVLIGYNKGKITPHETAYSIAGKLWNSPSTLYVSPSRNMFLGDTANESLLEEGTHILYR